LVTTKRMANTPPAFFGSNYRYGDVQVNSVSPSYDIMLLKINKQGDEQWLVRAGSLYEDAANAVCTDSEGNAILTGYFAGTASFGANTVVYQSYNDIFIAKYNPQGNNLWVRAGNGQELDVGFAITADANNNIYVTGMFQDQINFGVAQASGNYRDIFLISYTPDGDIRWLTKAGGGNTDCALGISLKPNGNVAICGYYLYTCTFGSIQIKYADINDYFVAEYNPPVVNSISRDIPIGSGVKLFPNPCPAGGYLNVYMENGTTTNIRVEDFQGRALYSLNGESPFRLPTSGLSKGMYVLKITTGQAVQTAPFVVE